MIYIDFSASEGHTRGKRIDEYRIVHFDDDDAVAAAEFLFVSRGINLDGTANAKEIAAMLRAFPRFEE